LNKLEVDDNVSGLTTSEKMLMKILQSDDIKANLNLAPQQL